MSGLQHILNAFKGPPEGPIPRDSDWSKVESQLGRRIPNDYKIIIGHTCGASVGNCFVRSPVDHRNVYTELSHSALNRMNILMADTFREIFNLGLYPEPGGLIHLAKKDNVHFMLKSAGDDIVIADASGWKLTATHMKFSDLMWSMFTHRELFDELGKSIWHNSNHFFGLH